LEKVHPYFIRNDKALLTLEKIIESAVVTFMDVTELKRANDKGR
jgi:hypothetical protein